MDYWIEILKDEEVFPAILITLVGIAYIVITFKKDSIFKGKLSGIRNLFSYKVNLLIIIGLIALWPQLNYSRIKKEAYYASIKPELRAYFDELMEIAWNQESGKEGGDGDFCKMSPKAKVNLQPIKTQFKAIAITADTLHQSVILEERINVELQKHGQYSIHPDSLDYIICFFQHWDSDLYSSNGTFATCETENAFIQIVDQKKHEIVDTIIIKRNNNPETITVEVNEFGFASSEQIALTPEELYDYCLRIAQKRTQKNPPTF